MFTSFPFAFWRGESGTIGFGYRYGYEFDGVDEYIGSFASRLPVQRDTAFSISFWARFDSLNSYVISDVSGGKGWWIYKSNGSVLFFAMRETLTSNEMTVSSTTSNVGTGIWQHCCFTFSGNSDASGFTVYLDGVDVGTTIGSNNLSVDINEANNLQIGASNGSGYIDGRLDDFQFYDFVLNATQVSDIYNNGYVTAPTAAPIHHWKLGEEDTFSTNWTVKDSVGSLDGTSVNMEEVDRKLGVAYSLDFDGVDDGVNFGDINDVEYNDSKTFSFWINTTDTNNGIIGKFNGSTGWNISLNSGGTVSLQMYNSALNRLDVSSTNTINGGAWKHIAITKTTSSSASGVEIYIDGVSETKIVNDDTLTSTTVTAHDFEFGSSSSFLNGYLTEISLFDSSLSSLEVADLYNSGVPVDPRNLGLTPSFYTPLVGPNDSYDGTNWTITDEIAGNNGASVNMQEADKTSETP